MKKKEPGNLNPRQCQQGVRTISEAKRRVQAFATVVAILAPIVGWGIFMSVADPKREEPLISYLMWGLTFFILGSQLFIAVEELRIAKELEREGIKVMGVIIDKWEAYVEWGSLFYAGYRFSYMDSLWVGQTSIATLSAYNKLQTEDSVTIRFLPRDPCISRIEQDGEC